MDTLMSEASQKCRLTTCVVSPNAISLLELEAGALPCSLPDGQVSGLCGQEAVLASHSHQQEKGLEQQTSGISGPCSLNSSASAALSMSLGNRLQARLGMGGSMEYRQTWKQKVTPAGRPYWAHTALAHRTSGRDFIGWPTPVVNDTTGSTHCYSGKNPDGSNKIALKLPGAAKLAGSESALRGNALEEMETSLETSVPFADLTTAMSVNAQGQHKTDTNTTSEMESFTHAGWPTASSRDWKDTPGMATTGVNPDGSERTRLDQLPRVAQLSGPLPSGIHAETGKRGALNPAFSLWLMGYPAEWVCCGEQAMQSFPKRQRSS